MAHNSADAHSSSTVVIVLQIIAILAVLAGIFFVINKAADTRNSASNDTRMPADTTTSETNATSPDPAKDTPNGDTQPSTSGTNPDGNNSLLSP